MNYRRFGRTGWMVSEIGLGAWQLGSDWGHVDEETAMATLHRAVDLGVNFIDTADVYGDGLSERRIGRLRQERKELFYVATKAGRRLNPHTAESYTKENLARFVERSLRNLGVETLDLLQLHCPPTEVYYRPEVFEALEDLKGEGKIQNYGVSVEKVEEGFKAIEYPGVESVQIIFNIFRQRPAEPFFREAKRRNVAVIVRVPLARGLLSGKMTRQTVFPPEDHRNYNREGKAFDVGETFAGVPFEVGLEAVEALRLLVPEGVAMAQFALRWILTFDAVSVVIPGAKRPAQVEENVAASRLPALSPEQMERVREVYDKYVRPYVHHRW